MLRSFMRQNDNHSLLLSKHHRFLGRYSQINKNYRFRNFCLLRVGRKTGAYEINLCKMSEYDWTNVIESYLAELVINYEGLFPRSKADR